MQNYGIKNRSFSVFECELISFCTIAHLPGGYRNIKLNFPGWRNIGHNRSRAKKE